MAVIYHPETQAYVEVPPESVPHYRQSGWVTREEWDESQQQQKAAREAPAVQLPQRKGKEEK
jgi:hypothetical protein